MVECFDVLVHMFVSRSMLKHELFTYNAKCLEQKSGTCMASVCHCPNDKSASASPIIWFHFEATRRAPIFYSHLASLAPPCAYIQICKCTKHARIKLNTLFLLLSQVNFWIRTR